MMDFRRILSAVLALVMVFSMLPVSGIAAQEPTEQTQAAVENQQGDMLLQEDFSVALGKTGKSQAVRPTMWKRVC